MIVYLFLCFSISLMTLNGVFLHKFANRGLKNVGDVFLFNGTMSLVWSVALLVLAMFTGGLQFNSQTLAFSVAYAIILCGYQLFKGLALSNGPISMTTLISNCAFLITTAYAYFIEGEPVTLIKLIGIVLLIISLFLCIYTKLDNKVTFKWIIFSVLLFLSGGSVGVIYKIFGKSSVSQNATSMVFFAALISAVTFLALAFTTNKKRQLPTPKLSKTAVKFAVICGITGCTYIRLNLSLSALIPSVIFFPLCNGLTVILSAIVGWQYFKEKLMPQQFVGIGLGMVAIVLIGCF